MLVAGRQDLRAAGAKSERTTSGLRIGFHDPQSGDRQVYRRILETPDDVVTRTSSYAEPPVPLAD